MLTYFIKIVILVAIVNQAFCFEANAVINLISKDNDPTSIRATYNIYQLNVAPFNLFRHIKMKEIETVSRTSHSKKLYSLLVNYKDQSFNLTTNDILFEEDPATGKYYTILEFEFGKVLNEVFKCKNYSRIYVSRFLFLDYAYKENTHILDDSSLVNFVDETFIFWVVTRKNSIKYDNEINYDEFLEDCHQTSRNYVLILLGFLLLMSTMGAASSFLHTILRKA